MLTDRYRPTFWKAVFFFIVAVGMVVTVIRFTQGLGAVTNLSDQFPWGIWIGFDVLCGVGLAAGGYTLTAMVYIFNVKRFRPVVRAAVLTAFLGYLLVVVALFFDLGRPWNLWRPMVFWNHHSVMFEVAWCVTLYTTVLSLEFSGMLFEKLDWQKLLKIQRMITLPLVVVGVILSTLHQSSLGALYLIVPGKLHTLWYTTNLPLLFFVSSVCVGLAMVIVESRISSRAFNRQLEMPLLTEIGQILLAMLAIYGVIKIFDLFQRGVLQVAMGSSYEARMFQFEVVLGLLLPLLLLLSPTLRHSIRGLYGASLLVVLGFVVNRLNVSITGLESAQGGSYVPAWPEVAVTLMLVALGFAAFSLAVRYLNVYPETEPQSITYRAQAPVRIETSRAMGSARTM